MSTTIKWTVSTSLPRGSASRATGGGDHPIHRPPPMGKSICRAPCSRRANACGHAYSPQDAGPLLPACVRPADINTIFFFHWLVSDSFFLPPHCYAGLTSWFRRLIKKARPTLVFNNIPKVFKSLNIFLQWNKFKSSNGTFFSRTFWNVFWQFINKHCDLF